jgi:hypothetical protein
LLLAAAAFALAPGAAGGDRSGFVVQTFVSDAGRRDLAACRLDPRPDLWPVRSEVAGAVRAWVLLLASRRPFSRRQRLHAD